ncbi:hypothetical protein CEXT_277031 [Caerostris extrusa]|uniref:Uncharacterized protein n=1 Tax=Caerostris extrusa TaxID=172846 RepID=A0AAV4XTT8_CAEEX|nr:hypothetical protein CEXT_277031 [Caerostris extrusa]
MFAGGISGSPGDYPEKRGSASPGKWHFPSREETHTLTKKKEKKGVDRRKFQEGFGLYISSTLACGILVMYFEVVPSIVVLSLKAIYRWPEANAVCSA